MQGKVALVTGGGGGIGRAACLEFARAGARVAVVDFDAQAGRATIEAVQQAGAEALFIPADVSLTADVQNYVNTVMQAWGRIDAFFNNAGIEGTVAPIPDFPEEIFDRVMAVNIKGVFLGMKYVLPIMLAQKSGSVVNTSSVSGLAGSPGFVAYVTSKHAIIGMTRVAAAESSRSGVRVNAICPGPINTRMIHAIEAFANPDNPEEVGRQYVAKNPSGRYGEPEEVARVVQFLCSDAASYVTGAIWTVDGGRTAI